MNEMEPQMDLDKELETLEGAWNEALLSVLQDRYSQAGKELPGVSKEELITQAPSLLEHLTQETSKDKAPFGFMIITGPSGGGKGVFSKELTKLGVSRLPRLGTREPRPGEIDGVDYHFIARDEFLNRLGEGEILAHTESLNRVDHAGYSKSELLGKAKRGEEFFIEAFRASLQVAGSPEIQEAKPLLTFLLPPSFPVLKERLFGRSTEERKIKGAGPEDWENLDRLRMSVQHLRDSASRVDLYIVNDKLDDLPRKAENAFLISRSKNDRF